MTNQPTPSTQRPGMTKRFVLVIPAEFDTRRNEYETASAWNRYTVLPGTYAVEPVDISHRPTAEGARPYYAKVVVDAILTETFYVNRLFTASSVDHQVGIDKPTTISLTPYWFAIDGEHADKYPWTPFGGHLTAVCDECGCPDDDHDWQAHEQAAGWVL